MSLNYTQYKIWVTEIEGKWRARITVNNKVYELGVYNNKDEAIHARLKAEKDFMAD